MPKKKILSVALLIICMLLSITVASCGSLIFTLTYESEEGGSVQGSKIQQVFKGDFGDKVIAVADEGYEFTCWSDGVTTPERQDTKVTADLTLTAQFKKIEQQQPTHICENVCGVCGKCTNTDCNEQVCLNKCDCTAVPPKPTHKCESVCNQCLGCLNGNCIESVCVTKCSCESILPHDCESVCEKCGKCLNGDCNEQACIIKCDCSKVEPHTHSYTAAVTQPTCTEQGFTHYLCDCGDSYIDSYVSANGHTAKESTRENEIPATCTAQGSYNEVVRCKDCNTVISSTPKTLPIIPHSYANGVCQSCGATDPTATEHSCQSVCVNCDGCLNASCHGEDCTTKCNCPPYYSLTYDAGEHGTLYGRATQFAWAGERGMQVEIVADVGYQFWCWSDEAPTTTPTSCRRIDTNVNQDITVTAIYKPCSITYSCENGGLLRCNKVEDTTIEVFMNTDGTFDEVTAVNVRGRDFGEWSDGVTTAARSDTGAFAGRKTVHAVFVKVPVYYTVKYLVDRDFGGTILGLAEQQVAYLGNSQTVIPLPNDGYIFTGWLDLYEGYSDDYAENQRFDVNVKTDLEFYAFFEAIEKSYTFIYNGANQALQTTITLNRYDNLASVKFPVPQRAGYEFCGWYLDTEYKNKVADENGKYYYGFMSFSVKETELYAKWKKLDEQQTVPIYKVLLIVNDSVVARLWSGEIQDYVDVDFKMLTIERFMLNGLSYWFAYLLNDWFEGEVIFEVDTYYTTQTLTPKSYNPDKWDGEKVLYQIFPYDVPEVADILNNYYGRLLFYGLRNIKALNNSVITGVTIGSDASVLLDKALTNNVLEAKYIDPYYFRTATATQLMERYHLFLGVALHEFCHTVENTALGIYSDDFHYFRDEFVFYKKQMNEMHLIKLFLLGELEAVTNEVHHKHSIPKDFWTRYL